MGHLAVQSTDVMTAADGLAPPLLTLHALERRWGSVAVLRGASLTLERATVTWLGGANGAGKTTLLRIAAALIMPHAGTVELCGLDPERDRRDYQRRLGYLSAGDRGLYARLTATQNLELWSGLSLVPRRRRAEVVRRAIERFGLESLAAQRVDRMSMGQRQRVRLAMTFLHDPVVVLLDEPHTSLDDAGLELRENALAEIAARDGAVLWCSPAAEHLPLHADVRYLLDAGQVIRG
jgi:ABC-2 type transport system ATP-binding protein